MEVLDKHVALRRSMHEFYESVFSNIEGITVFSTPNEDYFSNYWLTTVVIDSSKTKGKTREDLRLFLEQLNIESRPLWKPMHMQPVFKKYSYYGGKVAEELFENGLCLPSGSNLEESDKNRLEEAFVEFFK
jgi:dTDP-4-amino-4,6-dideoxygalactose transaminase